MHIFIVDVLVKGNTKSYLLKMVFLDMGSLISMNSF